MAQILRAGQWRSAAFIKYLEEADAILGTNVAQQYRDKAAKLGAPAPPAVVTEPKAEDQRRIGPSITSRP